MSAHPDVARMRMIPMPMHPDPASAPFPVAADPDESRVGPRRNDLDLHWWRFAGLFHDDFIGSNGFPHDDNAARLAFDNAAREKRQHGGDQDCLN
jgi:hypothetical protein